MDEQDHIARNRAAWSDWAADYAGPGERAWASPEPYWGIWGIPEEQVHLRPACCAPAVGSPSSRTAS